MGLFKKEKAAGEVGLGGGTISINPQKGRTEEQLLERLERQERNLVRLSKKDRSEVRFKDKIASLQIRIKITKLRIELAEIMGKG